MNNTTSDERKILIKHIHWTNVGFFRIWFVVIIISERAVEVSTHTFRPNSIPWAYFCFRYLFIGAACFCHFIFVSFLILSIQFHDQLWAQINLCKAKTNRIRNGADHLSVRFNFMYTCARAYTLTLMRILLLFFDTWKKTQNKSVPFKERFISHCDYTKRQFLINKHL